MVCYYCPIRSAFSKATQIGAPKIYEQFACFAPNVLPGRQIGQVLCGLDKGL